MAANMWKNSVKNVESDNNKILYETLLDFFLQRNGTYFLNKPLIFVWLRYLKSTHVLNILTRQIYITRFFQHKIDIYQTLCILTTVKHIGILIYTQHQ